MSFRVALGLVVVLILASIASWFLARKVTQEPTRRKIYVAAVGLLPALILILAHGLWSAVFAHLTRMPIQWFALRSLSAGAIVAVPVVMIWEPKWRARFIGALLLLFSFLALADVIYWRFFDSLMPLAATESAGLAADVSASILATMQSSDLMLLGFVVAAVPFFFWPRSKSLKRPDHLKTMAVGLGVLAFAVIPSINDISAFLDHRRSWKVFGWDAVVKHVGVVQSHARDFARTYRERTYRVSISDAEVDALSVANQAIRQSVAKRQASETFGAAKGLNVVILQIEALQAWTIDAELDGQPLTPVLNVVNQYGDSYSNIWDVTGGSPTSDCEYAVMNSQYPLAQGSVAFRRASNTFAALPSQLAAEGYATMSGHANRPGMWNRGVIHPKWGIETSYWGDKYPRRPRYGWGLADHVFLKKSMDRLKSAKSPFFGFFITLTSHHPYSYLPRKLRTFKKAKIHHDVRNYAASVRYVDGAIEDALRQLKRNGHLKNTLVVLYGDHDSKLKFQKSTQKKLTKMVGMSKWEAKIVSARRWGMKKIPLFFLRPEQSQNVLDVIDANKAAKAGNANNATTAKKPGDKKPVAQAVAPVVPPAADIDVAPSNPPEEPEATEGAQSGDDGQSRVTVDTVGSQVDIGPTILHYLGLPIPASYVGQPLTAGAIGFAARLDGSAVNSAVLYDTKGPACTTHDGKGLNQSKCAAAKARAETTLERSWSITLNDLAKRVNDAEKTPAPSPAR